MEKISGATFVFDHDGDHGRLGAAEFADNVDVWEEIRVEPVEFIDAG